MDEKKIERMTSQLMLTVSNMTDDTRENWLAVYTALHAVLRIHECDPRVFMHNISPGIMHEQEQVGKSLGDKVAEEADNFSKTFRN